MDHFGHVKLNYMQKKNMKLFLVDDFFGWPFQSKEENIFINKRRDTIFSRLFFALIIVFAIVYTQIAIVSKTLFLCCCFVCLMLQKQFS